MSEQLRFSFDPPAGSGREAPTRPPSPSLNQILKIPGSPQRLLSDSAKGNSSFPCGPGRENDPFSYDELARRLLNLITAVQQPPARVPRRARFQHISEVCA